MTTLKNIILHTLEENKIAMIPRWKFALFSILWAALLSFSFVALIFVMSLVLFILAKYGLVFLPFFGLQEVLTLIKSLPIVLTLLTIVLLFVVEVLVKRYAFAFRQSFVPVFLGLTLISCVGSFLVALTPFHEEIDLYARDHKLSFIKNTYGRPIPPHMEKGLTVLRGIVSSSTDREFYLYTPDDEAVYVRTSSTSPDFPFMFSEGEDLVVMGMFNGEVFEVIHMMEASKNKYLPRGRH